ncbi:MAG TPA: C45 family autoproteolytic acyltransferase/hydrolase [Geminicoccaceae bacterium]|nr:C45 family autoproteolytic acyltransferase/hydrolase [Geminicoccus sp.]HMU52661.1 C45 family autoproteolytic acyltransferase/hydrolase [Geminicoccaceae bacterium]
MRPSAARPGRPLLLRGDPYARGRAQAARHPDLVDHVRHAVEHRLAETAAALALPRVRDFIRAQHAFTAGHYPEILVEIDGIADGFGLPAATVFDYLHCSSAADLAAQPGHDPDGCTAFAASAPGGAIVAKNRDYRPQHVPIQQVMHHADPAWGGREIMVVGSLGSPGNFSSGINSDGLALADTASRTTDMGVGLHRYFLMTWLLVNCADVDAALAAIRRTPHTGSGLLVLGDATGAVAAVELGHRAVGFEHRSSGRVGRTNHFVTPAMRRRNLHAPESAASRANSEDRFGSLLPLLDGLDEPPDADAAGTLLGRHGATDAFCRHGGADLSTTIAGAVYLTAERRLLAVLGQPCRDTWQSYQLAGRQPGADAR